MRIIDKIVQNWSKGRGARIALYDEWLIHKDSDSTIEEFNRIWEVATQRVKGRKPKESAQEIINKLS